MKRFASVWLPDWPIERLKRQGSGMVPDDAPFVLVKPTPRGLLITAVNRRARAEGIAMGETLADARARLRGLIARPASESEDAAALLALARWCGRYGPSRNIDGSDGLCIDITGVGHLFGDEAGLAQDLERRLTGFGLTAQIGIADTIGAAFALARTPHDETNRLSACGAAATTAALAGLPVEALRLAPDQVTTLHRLGLRHIGQLYDIPRASLERRFAGGKSAVAVLRRLDQALGRLAEPFRPLAALPVLGVQHRLAEPLLSAAGVEAEVDQLVTRLCAILAESEMGARRLRLSLYRTDGSSCEICVGAHRPCRTPGHLLELLREKLSGIDAGFGIDGMQVAALIVEPLAVEQTSLSARVQNERREGGGLLIDKLANRLGAARVYRLKAQASHIPERAQQRRPMCAGQMAPPPLPLLATSQTAAPPQHRCRPPLLLSPPEPVAVLAEVPEGPPVRFQWRRVLHRIVKAEGPERIEPEWWRRLATGRTALCAETALQLVRDYYRIEDDSGRRYWLFRAGRYDAASEAADAASPRWYLHGVFA